MAAAKQRYRNGQCVRIRQLPSLSPERASIAPQSQVPQTHPALTRSERKLKDEALYLASILHARLSDSALSGGGRGLLSRALSTGDLDQFLVEFFCSPANLLFGKEKVEARKRKIAEIVAKRAASLEGGDDNTLRVHPTGSTREGLGAASTCYSGRPELLERNPIDTSLGRERFGPLLIDATGNILPARGVTFKPQRRNNASDAYMFTGSGTRSEQSGADSTLLYGPLSTLNSEASEPSDTCYGINTAVRGCRNKEKENSQLSPFCRSKELGSAKSFHFEGHLLHRVCAVTGKLPDGSDLGSSCDQSESSLSEFFKDDQLARLRRNPEIMRILTSLKALLGSLRGPSRTSGVDLEYPDNARWELFARRQCDVTVVKSTHTAYLQLFEEMLGELLRMQRMKTKAAREEKRAMLSDLERLRKAEAVLKDEADVHAVQLEALLAMKHALATEVATQEAQLTCLTSDVETRIKMERAAKTEHYAAETKKRTLLNNLKEEEFRFRTRFKEVEVEATKAEMGVRSMEHLTAKVERTAAISDQMKKMNDRKYKEIQEAAEAFTQTMADDDGLWDFQDGCTREMSRNVYLRLKWQALRRFASCPSCHGLGLHTKVFSQGDKKNKKKFIVATKDRAGEDPTLLHRHFKRTKLAQDRCWAMPNALVEFMWHLPKTAQSLPIKPLRWLTREIWSILDERERADAIDEREGQHIQGMNDFVVELFLRRHSLRQDAELQLYVFLISLKAHYKKNAGAHIFARLMDLVNDPSDTAADGHGASSGSHHDQKGLKDKKDGRLKGAVDHHRREEELLEEEVQPHSSPLSTEFIPVLLFTRRALLKRRKIDLAAEDRDKAKSRFEEAVAASAAQDDDKTDPPRKTRLDGKYTVMPIVNAHTPQSPGSGVITAVAATILAVAANQQHTTGKNSNDEDREREKPVQTKASATVGPKSSAAVTKLSKVDTAPILLTLNSNVQPKRRDHQLVAPSGVKFNISSTQGPHSGGGAEGIEADRNCSSSTQSNAKKSSPLKKKASHRTTSSHNSSGYFGHASQGNATAKKGGSGGAGKRATSTATTPASASASATATVTTTDIAKGGLEDVERCNGTDAKVEGDSVEPIEIPPHVLTEDYCTFWVLLETAVRVLAIVLHWCPVIKRHAYMRSIEKTAALLTPRGHITGAEACHSFIRSAMRKTIAAVESEFIDSDGNMNIAQHLGRVGNGVSASEALGAASGVIGGYEAAQQDDRVVIDMDSVVELVMEVLLLRQHSIEGKLRVLFTEGDDNGDGVLSFEEFNGIIYRAAPHFSERRVLRMFREALTSGSEGSFAIEKETFCNVCRQHGLVQLINIASLEGVAEVSNDARLTSRLTAKLLPEPPNDAVPTAASAITSMVPSVTPLAG